MSADGARREEILQTAASLFASAGIRTSLKEIGDACGILPGSLYHHFESKEAIIVELVRRYRDELDRIAKEALDSLHEPEQPPVEARVVALAEQIAACAIQNRAALLVTLYEPPAAAGRELVDLAVQAPTAISAAMEQILVAGRAGGEVRDGIDLELLGERICHSMLHMGVGDFHRSSAARQLPAQKCRVYLHGVATKAPADRTLDRSAAMRAARGAVAGWSAADDDDRAAHLRAVARAEFGRRGFEATTIRDIAKAAELSTGTVYRMFRSKDELLLSIMQAFSEAVASGWDAVLGSAAPPIEQLDALLWVNDNLVDRFSEELKIQLAWFRQSPPDSVDLAFSFGRQLRQLQALLAAGATAGELQVEGGSAADRTRSMYELLLTPEHVLQRGGLAGAHALSRDTVLRGALTHR